MIADGCTHFVEVGPHAVLSGALMECLDGRGAIPVDEAVVPTLRRGHDAAAAFLDAVAALHCRGYEVDWERLAPRLGSVVALPTYPWQRQRLWKSDFHPWNRGAVDLGPLCYAIEWQPIDVERPSSPVPENDESSFRDVLRRVQDMAERPESLRIVTSDPGLLAFGRVIANERPELRCTRIEGAADLVPPDIDEPEIAVRDGGIFVPRVVRAPLPSGEVRVRADSTYLLTGGYGALGCIAAEVLVGCGARNLVLVGRGGPPQSAIESIDALRRGGARVEIERADVSDAGALGRVFDRIARDMPPLAGVVHAAGVLEDAMLQHLTPEALARVMAPKAIGARNLHELTKDLPLDFFLLLSSAAVLLGSPGQGAYVAANAEMEAVVHLRRRLGLPAAALQLGLVAGGGMGGMGGGRNARDEGVAELTRDEVRRVFERFLGAEGVLAIVRLDAERWVRAYPGSRKLFSALLAPDEDEAPRPPIAGIADIRAELTAIVAEVTKNPPASIDIHRPLQELGVDSLMTIRIRSAVSRRFGVEVPITAFWRYPTIFAFAGYMASQIETGKERAQQRR
jgi:acyl carrier protein/nucleoside-diphosphate-sugar epimerase